MSDNNIARAFGQQCFVVKETTRGTLVFPSAAAELVKAAGYAEMNQQPSFSDSEEMEETLDVLDSFQDQAAEGSFSIPTYLRPSGTKGTAPMAGVLFESLQGVETVNASTDVQYTQATTKPSFSMWLKKDHTVFFGRGGCVSKASLSLGNKGGSKITFTGGFMELGWAGTDVVVGAVTASTAVTVEDGDKFTAGGRVQIGSDDNSGAGYEISSVSGNDLTMAENVTCLDGAEIKGFLPSFTAVGSPLQSKNTVFKIDDVATKFTNISLDIGSPVEYQTDENTDDGFPADYVENNRAIAGTADIKFRRDDTGKFKDGKNGTKKALDITLGDTAGSIVQILLGHSLMEVPAVNTTAPTVSLSIPFRCQGNVGEDSCVIIFK
ncbi:MAG TPA: hypothetical protein DHV36_15770 [Desulfobacteraceae bacterium]|nr:hypothetical protein [Desulfobacteraceae bacterium]|tara:strand:+ start:271 stop:1407 length:1137 start_codon:yes stop_codon:yes gene_type:complete